MIMVPPQVLALTIPEFLPYHMWEWYLREFIFPRARFLHVSTLLHLVIILKKLKYHRKFVLVLFIFDAQ